MKIKHRNNHRRHHWHRPLLWLAALMLVIGTGQAAPDPQELVSIQSMCRKHGWQCALDANRRILYCSRQNQSLRFGKDAWFCIVNDTLRQMPAACIVRDTIFCLARSALNPLFGIAESKPVVIVDSAMHRDTTPAPSPTPAPRKTAVPAAARSFQVIKTIVLDAGHGGKDPGAIGPDGVQEKSIVLATALALRDALKKRTGAAIYMTRDDDTFIPLNKRTKFANDKRADLFVSLHANSVPPIKRNATKGFKIFFLSAAKNEEDRQVAMMENSVIELEDETEKGSYLQNVLTDLVSNEHLTESQDMSIMLAETFHSSLKQINKLHLGVGQANFYVLNGAYMPAVLIELGFISHPQEEKLLSDKAFQEKLAAAIADAIIGFQSKYEVTNE
jgi:N-acetylmuramoyl-L-alanine amidase